MRCGATNRYGLLGVGLCAVTMAAAAPQPVGTWRAEVRSDPPPVEITRGKHYINSDERRHDLFRPAIADRGGLFIGVGSSQNYVMAAWAKADGLLVVDFDQVIIDLHRVYEVIFKQTDSPEAFLAAWSRDHRAETRQWIDQAYPERKSRWPVKRAFNEYRPNIVWGLNQLHDRLKKQNQSSFLDDPEQFAWLKKLFSEDRVLFLRGDFTAQRTLHDLGELARRESMPIGVLYLSNVEQYFGWSQGHYRKNMLGLPLTKESVVLRCYGSGPDFAADHNYKYFVQKGDNFHIWLSHPDQPGLPKLLKSRQRSGSRGFFQLSAMPPNKKNRSPKVRNERTPSSSEG